MAYWGLAMSNVNNGKRAKEFMKEVEEALESERLTERERLYLKSLHRFYHGGEKDTKKRYRELVRDYEDIALRFSEDIKLKLERSLLSRFGTTAAKGCRVSSRPVSGCDDSASTRCEAYASCSSLQDSFVG